MAGRKIVKLMDHAIKVGAPLLVSWILEEQEFRRGDESRWHGEYSLEIQWLLELFRK